MEDLMEEQIRCVNEQMFSMHEPSFRRELRQAGRLRSEEDLKYFIEALARYAHCRKAQIYALHGDTVKARDSLHLAKVAIDHMDDERRIRANETAYMNVYNRVQRIIGTNALQQIEEKR